MELKYSYEALKSPAAGHRDRENDDSSGFLRTQFLNEAVNFVKDSADAVIMVTRNHLVGARSAGEQRIVRGGCIWKTNAAFFIRKSRTELERLPDCASHILTDRNGTELCLLIKNFDPKTPIVFVTGTSSMTQKQAKMVGAQDLIRTGSDNFVE